MVEIKLGTGQVVLVDDADFPLVSNYSWFFHSSRGKSYARCDLPKGSIPTRVFMHRIIMAPLEEKEEIDHINGDGLDNRRQNLRKCNRSGNNRNRRLNSNNTTGFKGVRLHRPTRKFVAQINVGKRKIALGYFPTAAEAAKKYDEVAIKIFGEFASTNVMLGLLEPL